MIHPTAIVHPSAVIAKEAEIGPFCLVGENVAIGARTMLLAHVVVNGWTTIGEDTVVHPFTTIGAPSQDRKAVPGEKSLVTVGDRTTIREFVSIHRATGAGETTSVGDDCLLLAYVHVAHNCRVGDGVTMSNMAQLAGHVEVGDHATVGAKVGVHQFVRIGRYSMTGGGSLLVRDAPPYFLTDGNPAKVYGLNSVGLRRANFPPEALAELKRAYKTIYRSDRNLSQAVAALRDEMTTDVGKDLLAFFEAPSERGVTIK